ncbi:MAG: M24 family metallopeptidase [Caldilineaceae bacterium]
MADAAARQVIADTDCMANNMHRLGHGIGMVYEPPFLTADDQAILQPGMCLQPSQYFYAIYRLGCRVEDVVVVRADGGEPLTAGHKQLFVVA